MPRNMWTSKQKHVHQVPTSAPAQQASEFRQAPREHLPGNDATNTTKTDDEVRSNTQPTSPTEIAATGFEDHRTSSSLCPHRKSVLHKAGLDLIDCVEPDPMRSDLAEAGLDQIESGTAESDEGDAFNSDNNQSRYAKR